MQGQMFRGEIPHTPEEYRWAQRRPAPHRVPIPAVGDEVMYRHDPNGPVVAATVRAVQDLEDLTDENLWYFQTDEQGRTVHLEGRPVLAQRHDPWPELTLFVPAMPPTQGMDHPGPAIVITREARLRGEPGWLPPDWQTRARPHPEVLVLRAGQE